MKIGELLEHFHGDNWIRIHDRHLYKTSVYKRRGVLEKYGNCNGKLQEKEGPAIAAKLLTELGFSREVSERVQYLIAHHHTYNNIDGIDYQILVEADFLVNMCEDELSEEALQTAYRNIFRTETGKKICREMYDIA